MKRHIIALLLLACAGCAPVVTKVNVADIAKSDSLQVADRRPPSEKENKIFSLLITSKQYGVIRTGDVHLSPGPVRLLQHEVYEKLAPEGGSHQVTVYHFVIYQNMRSQLRSGAIGAGLGGLLGAAIASSMNAHDAWAQTRLIDEARFDAVSDEYMRGLYDASEDPNHASVFIIYIDTDIDGHKTFTRTLAPMAPQGDHKNTLADAVELAIKNHLSQYGASGAVMAAAASPAAASASTSVTTNATPAAAGGVQLASSNAGLLSRAQSAANQIGCGAVRPSDGSTFTASCGSYDVVIDCDGGSCHPTHTVKATQ